MRVVGRLAREVLDAATRLVATAGLGSGCSISSVVSPAPGWSTSLGLGSRLLTLTLTLTTRLVATAGPGLTTDEIDAVVHRETVARGAYPSPLNYRGFPKSCCTSVDEVICHGIPDSRALRDGEIVNIEP